MLPELWKKELINIQEDLVTKHEKVDWVHETAAQLIKDFAMLQLPLEFEPFDEEKYSALFDQAVEKIGDLYINNYHAFLNLLYRIDLDERKLHQLVAASNPPLLYEQITELILKREFLKVFYRFQYKADDV
jgi:hypothetical protein